MCRSGWGFPRHKLDRVQTTLPSKAELAGRWDQAHAEDQHSQHSQEESLAGEDHQVEEDQSKRPLGERMNLNRSGPSDGVMVTI